VVGWVRVSELGEFELIERLTARLKGSLPSGLLLSIGDDAAAWTPSPGGITVATTDALVQDVHFALSSTSWRDLGWKALAENVSDVAAMGAAPRYALVALGVPGDTLVADLEALYDGFDECARSFAFAVVGGDVVRAPCVILQVTLVGETVAVPDDPGGQPRLLTRDGAHAGNLLALTGPVGGSAAGLRLLMEGTSCSPGDQVLIEAHRRPKPRVAAGRALLEAGIRCALDVSDGLVQDVRHICERSQLDAELETERIPLFPEAVERFGPEARELGLTGGEDYELVCAGPAEVIKRASALLQSRGELPLKIVGRVVARTGREPVVRVRDAGGELRSIAQGGYQHFGSSVS
jgi:thiamine-monophosphate kinase